MNGSDDRSGADTTFTIHERAHEHRLKLWFLLSVNRWALAGGMVAIVFVSLVVLGAFGPGSVTALLEADAVTGVFQSMIVAVITVVGLVLIIGQITIVQTNAPLDEFRDRMEGSLDFQTDVENVTDVAVSPAAPSVFLHSLVGTARNRAETLREVVEDNPDEQLREHVDGYVNDLIENSDRVGRRLQRATFGTFDAHEAMLNYEYSRHIYATRRIRSNYADQLSGEARGILDQLLRVLMFFGAAREHFETTYFQWEIIDLSRSLVYTGIPALVIAAYMAFFFDTNAVSGATLGVNHLLVTVSAAFTLASVPFLLLLAYVVRILTAAKRTMVIGPFVLWEPTESDESGSKS